MKEIITNLHVHTTYSDGSRDHLDVIQTAANSGIDALIFTDHNILVDGIEGYYDVNNKKILVIMGEEIHNPNLQPQKNHLLTLGIKEDLSYLGENRQALIIKTKESGGASFLAHPYDPELPDFNEPNISWDDWSVWDYDGIELWNGSSELKVRTRHKLDAFFYAFFPKFLPVSPPEQTIEIWDHLHAEGRMISAVAGSDAHELSYSAGPFRRSIFPYTFHFKSVNNHLVLQENLSGQFADDKAAVVKALRMGRNYLANDLLGNTAGFKYFIKTDDGKQSGMGEKLRYAPGLSIIVKIPRKATIRVIKDGVCILKQRNTSSIDLPIDTKGVYRVECYRRYRGKTRAWIISNPIYVD